MVDRDQHRMEIGQTRDWSAEQGQAVCLLLLHTSFTYFKDQPGYSLHFALFAHVCLHIPVKDRMLKKGSRLSTNSKTLLLGQTASNVLRNDP